MLNKCCYQEEVAKRKAPTREFFQDSVTAVEAARGAPMRQPQFRTATGLANDYIIEIIA
jgi:hypothetical protein